MKKILSVFIVIVCVFLLSINLKAYNSASTLKPYVTVDTEFRAVWVASVWNLNIPKQKDTSTESINKWKSEYLKIIENAKLYNLNAIIFQVRPCNDAFYPSKYNPWSEYLCGYGVDPGWDPLEWMIEVTHEAGLEYHAWLNPYRASTDQDISINHNEGNVSKIYDYDDEALQNHKMDFFGRLRNKAGINYLEEEYDNPIFKSGKDLESAVVLGSEDKYILNPASSDTIHHLENTISEIVDNYEIDGIHFDDYFYPNTKSYSTLGSVTKYKGITFSCEPRIDFSDYENYKSNGGTLSIYDWRRENVNNLILSLSNIIREKNKTKDIPCAFGISPCARWAPSFEACPAGSERAAEGGMSGSCNNYYSYADLYADTKKWALEGWIDYILPQAYTKLDGSYEQIVSWWSNVLKNSKVKLYIGTGLYKQDSAEWNYDSLEVFYQIRYNQSYKIRTDGYSIYDYDAMLTGKGKAGMSTITKALWKTNALTPIYDSYNYKHTVSSLSKVEQLKKTGDTSYEITYGKVDDAKAYAIYQIIEPALLHTDNDVIGKNLISMSLTPNSVLTIPKYGENISYCLVTISQDNTCYLSEMIDFSKAIVNNPPTVEFENIKNEYLLSSSVSFKINLLDDSESLKVKVFAVVGNEETLIRDSNFKPGVIDLKWTHGLSADVRGIKFKVVVVDDANTFEFISDPFTLVEECSVHKPVDATCTTGSYCEVCDKVLSEALGHTVVDGECTICHEKFGNTDLPIVIEPKKNKGCKKANIGLALIINIFTVCIFIKRKEK